MVHGRANSHLRLLTAGVLLVFGFQAYAEPEVVPGEYVVKLKPTMSARHAIKTMDFGAETLAVVSGQHHIIKVKRNILERPEYSLAELKANSAIEIVEPNYIYRAEKLPNDPDLGDVWGLLNTGKKSGRVGVDIGAEQAWDIETGKDSVLVAIIDTGVDYTHPDLAANIWTNQAEANGKPGVDDDKNGYVDDIHGYDFVNDDGDPMDDNGHGTHVSGTIGARGNDGVGISGVNWNVRIVGAKFLSDSGGGTLAAAISAIDYAVAVGARVLNNSWGGGGRSELLNQAIERARDKNALFVAAAGNDGTNNDKQPHYPSNYKVENILSVAAIKNTGELAVFSDYGIRTVHVAAPGQDIMSTVPNFLDPSGYARFSGTSMATPHVTGIAALLIANNPKLTYAELRDRIIETAAPLGSLRGKVASGGVANAYYALTQQTPPADPLDPFNWASKPESKSTDHPYQNKSKKKQVFNVPGAKHMTVFFERFEVEQDYDFAIIRDGKGNIVSTMSGDHNGEFSPVVDGDTLTIEFQSDDSQALYGYDVTKVAFTN